MESLITILAALSAAGAVGGIVVGVVARASHKLRIPFWGKLVELGFLGDALIGGGASLAAYFLLAPLLNMTVSEELTPDNWVQMISLGVLSGFVGVRALSTSKAYIIEKLGSVEERLGHLETESAVAELIHQAECLATNNRPQHALAKYDEALSINPRNEAALLGKASVLCQRCKWDEAIRTVSRVLEVNPSSARAYYDRARYENSTGKHAKEVILQDLKSAIALDPTYRESVALGDNHFDNLRQDEGFKSIVR